MKQERRNRTRAANWRLLVRGPRSLALSLDWLADGRWHNLPGFGTISQPRHRSLFLTARKNGTLPAKSPKPVLGESPAGDYRWKNRKPQQRWCTMRSPARRVSYTPWLYELGCSSRDGLELFRSGNVAAGQRSASASDWNNQTRRLQPRHASQRIGRASGVRTDHRPDLPPASAKSGRDGIISSGYPPQDSGRPALPGVIAVPRAKCEITRTACDDASCCRSDPCPVQGSP